MFRRRRRRSFGARPIRGRSRYRARRVNRGRGRRSAGRRAMVIGYRM